MDIVKSIFFICTQILRANINLFGYPVSLLEVMVFVFIGGLLLALMKSVF